MQTLTIALLKEKGLEFANAGLLGASEYDGCVYRDNRGHRCIAGATFTDETLAEIYTQEVNGGAALDDLVNMGIVNPENDRTKEIYGISQGIHDAWAAECTTILPSGFKELTQAEMDFLEPLRFRVPSIDDLKAWLELIQ